MTIRSPMGYQFNFLVNCIGYFSLILGNIIFSTYSRYVDIAFTVFST